MDTQLSVISFLYALHPSRSTITGICVTDDLGDIVVFCDAHRGLEFYAFPRGGEVAGTRYDIENGV